VQVLKEGVGTKGPTLTSYLSIPGRFLVMMPQMDRVGVSRKVEDEEQRARMREILDQLDLPDGFGFILRTAGFDRNKTELKRDLAYLQRLWKDMEARLAAGDRPRLLYSESDLLVRALRDMTGPEIEEVVIDNEQALKRAARFLKIVAPRSRVKLLQYQGITPLFHAFGVEQQIALIHAREVPLPSGGRLVIDETEALVAIDVNSGKMRDARDAETNAYRTNLEAVDEICRQLKLRDLGGIVINDLIDMRHASHRKDIEQRFRDRLKRDRARTTTLAISEFGVLEMTRQRMRGSHESVHFTSCPTCHGRGLVQRPDSVAADAMRNLAALLDYERVAKVEVVVGPRVASELLSSRRQTLGRLERRAGKHVDVRVSETVGIDRVAFYAYDEAGADIEIEKLPKPTPPIDLKPWEFADKDDAAWAGGVADETPVEPEAEAEPEMQAHPIEFDEVEGPEPAVVEAAGAPAQDEGGGRRRRRRRRRGRGRGGQGALPAAPGAEGAPRPVEAGAEVPGAPEGAADETREVVASDGQVGAGAPPGMDTGVGGPGQPMAGPGGRRRRRRRRRGRGGRGQDGAPISDGGMAPANGPAAGTQGEQAPPDEGPRGDSWDVEPSAVPPLHVVPSTDAGVVEDAGEAGPPPEPMGVAGMPGAAGNEPAASGEGRRRRRRRRRGRGGGGGGGGGGIAGGGAPDGTAAGAPPQRTGGYRRAPQPPAPPPSPPPQPAAQRPAPQPAGESPRFLYSSRRKLAPGEIARRPPE
jgi:ribonuclease E